MYNRYIPQPDGSYRRNRMPESSRPQQSQRPPADRQRPKQEACPPPEQPPCPPKKQQSCPPPKPQPCRQEPERRCDRPAHHSQGNNVGGFLRNLLPKDFDTGDLIIVLLLLLMAGDCEDDKNNALLTLALYFLM